MRLLAAILLTGCSMQYPGYESGQSSKMDRGIDTKVYVKNSDSVNVFIRYEFYLNYPDTLIKDTTR